jgi:two-component system, cell cycle sensor histidine kinase and response regulator CckA
MSRADRAEPRRPGGCHSASGQTRADAGDRAATATPPSDEHYRAMLDLAPVAICIARDGLILEANRRCRSMLRLAGDAELVGRRWIDFVAPHCRVELETYARRRSAGEPAPGEYESFGLRADGSQFPMHVAVLPLDLAGWHAEVGVITDLSDRKLLEAQVRERSAFAETVIAGSGEGVMVYDRDLNYRIWNRAMEEMTGLAADQVLGRRALDLFPEREAAGIERNMRRIVETGEPETREFAFTIPRTSRCAWVLGTYRPHRNPEGEIVGVIASIRDITARRAAERALAQSEAKFATAFRTSPDSININRLADGLFLDISDGFTATTGFTHADVAGKTSAEIAIWADPAQRDQLVASLRSDGVAHNLEMTFRRKDGSLGTGLMSARVIDIEGEPCILSITRDITDRKQADAERAALQDQFLQAQKMEGIGRLAGGIAHDFNNLLTAIRGHASLALLDMPSIEGVQADLEQIEQACDRAAALTRQLLTFARKNVAMPEAMELGAVVRRIEPMLRRLVREDIRLVTATTADAGTVMADVGQVEQVIVNLVVNAGDAMPDGGALTIETASGVRGGINVTTLSVTDTGVGMDSQVLAHIFEPFFTTKDAARGTGLGLATVYGIVREAGGTIEVASAPGRGSTFSVCLPRLETPARVIEEYRPTGPGAPARTGTILVVEDDGGVAGFATRALKRAGYRVLAFSDGATAVSQALDEPVDLLLTDVVMPGLRGRDVVAAFSAVVPGIRVLYMSGHAAQGFAPDGMLELESGFLPKPFSTSQLLEAVQRAMSVEGPR